MLPDGSMRVGVTFLPNDRMLSGVDYYTLGLIRSIAARVDQVHLDVLTTHPDVVHQEVAPCSSVTVRPVPLLKWRMARVLWQQLALPALASRLGLDLLHCPCYIGPVVSKIPVVLTVHDTIALDNPEFCRLSNSLHYRLMLRRSILSSAATVAVSQATASSIARHVSIDRARNRVHVVYPGVDDIFFHRASDQEQVSVRQKYRLPRDYVLFVGNIEPKKNLPYLLSVYAALRTRCPAMGLVLTGGRRWRSGHVMGRLQNGGLQGAHLLGHVERHELPSLYQMARAYLCLSHYEGFGFPPLEAMAGGTVVVSTEGGALKETLANAPVWVPHVDPDQVVRRLVSVLSRPDAVEWHVETGRQRAQNYQWQRFSHEMLAVYDHVLGKRAAG